MLTTSDNFALKLIFQSHLAAFKTSISCRLTHSSHPLESRTFCAAAFSAETLKFSAAGEKSCSAFCRKELRLDLARGARVSLHLGCAPVLQQPLFFSSSVYLTLGQRRATMIKKKHNLLGNVIILLLNNVVIAAG